MALGAITIGSIKELKDGSKMIRISFAGDGAYPTGGTATFKDLLQDAIEAAAALAVDANVRGRQNVAPIAVIPQDCGQYVPSYAAATDKLFVRDGGHATWNEVGNGVNLSGTTFNVLVLCY